MRQSESGKSDKSMWNSSQSGSVLRLWSGRSCGVTCKFWSAENVEFAGKCGMQKMSEYTTQVWRHCFNLCVAPSLQEPRMSSISEGRKWWKDGRLNVERGRNERRKVCSWSWLILVDLSWLQSWGLIQGERNLYTESSEILEFNY